eukprot:6195717-Pyramimonas_sp.AAC.2
MGCSDVAAKLSECRIKTRRAQSVEHYAVLSLNHAASSADIKQVQRITVLLCYSITVSLYWAHRIAVSLYHWDSVPAGQSAG